jgi:hypothetical protein
VRVSVIWARVAPRVRPGSFDPADPSSPGYDWTAVDAAVRDLSSRGLRVLLNIWGAPGWAQGPGRASRRQTGFVAPRRRAAGALRGGRRCPL